MSTTCKEKSGLAAYVIAALGALLIMAALVSLMKKYTTPAPLGADRAAERMKARAELTAEETKALTSYGWQDEPRQIVRLPIERAKELTLQNLKNPEAARKDLQARLAKATAAAPKVPEKPSAFE
ncbi:MAG: hypothetical protein HY301_08955 [Verrucomicrobia bacterium]|nr:hypothetical protein [Verrucomicrobiota bacterium]